MAINHNTCVSGTTTKPEDYGAFCYSGHPDVGLRNAAQRRGDAGPAGRAHGRVSLGADGHVQRARGLRPAAVVGTDVARPGRRGAVRDGGKAPALAGDRLDIRARGRRSYLQYGFGHRSERRGDRAIPQDVRVRTLRTGGYARRRVLRVRCAGGRALRHDHLLRHMVSGSLAHPGWHGRGGDIAPDADRLCRSRRGAVDHARSISAMSSTSTASAPAATGARSCAARMAAYCIRPAAASSSSRWRSISRTCVDRASAAS